jgi:hypothetical protein
LGILILSGLTGVGTTKTMQLHSVCGLLVEYLVVESLYALPLFWIDDTKDRKEKERHEERYRENG